MHLEFEYALEFIEFIHICLVTSKITNKQVNQRGNQRVHVYPYATKEQNL